MSSSLPLLPPLCLFLALLLPLAHSLVVSPSLFFTPSISCFPLTHYTLFFSRSQCLSVSFLLSCSSSPAHPISSSLVLFSVSLSCSLLLYRPSWTSSLYLHRWFQWLLWVLIIPPITVGKCAIKVDSYSVPCDFIFIRVAPDFWRLRSLSVLHAIFFFASRYVCGRSYGKWHILFP